VSSCTTLTGQRSLDAIKSWSLVKCFSHGHQAEPQTK